MKIRHIISLLLLIVSGVFQIQAQLAVGSWKQFSSFASVDKVIDTPHYVYYITNGQLYSRDKDNEETYNYSTGNRLSDNNISDIFFDYDNGSLFVAYANANIDIIDSEGHVYNMPDIKDASMDIIPVINDVDFDDDRIYVATNFGVVVFDARRYEVITAGNYGKNMTSVMVQGNNLWLIEDYKYYCADKSKDLTSSSSIVLQNFGYTTSKIMQLNDELAVVIGNKGAKLLIIKIKPGDSSMTYISNNNVTGMKNLQRLVDGSFMAHTCDTIYLIDKEGKIETVSVVGSDMETVKVGSVYETKQIASCKGLGELWLGSDAGLACYSLKDGELTVLSEPARPDNGLTFSNVGRLYTAPSGAIYATSYGFSLVLGDLVNPGNSEHGLFYINKIDNGEIIDLTPYEYTVKNRNHKPYDTSPVGFKGGYTVKEDPNDPEGYVVGSMWDGFYYMKDGKEQAHYYVDNSSLPLMMNYRMEAQGIDFDKKGNLWVAVSVDKDEKQFHMLKADKVGKNTTPEDWQYVEDQAETYHNGVLHVCRHSDNIFYFDAGYQSHPTILKTFGTETLKDDKTIISTEFIDQDGNKFSFNRTLCIIEDNMGRIWLGTDNGVVEITRPDDITGGQFRINHLKVPRRDGTNFADYLLNGETICDMAVDPSNRKWIATRNSGVYLVNENGDEILEHFDPTNSPLPSYSVFAVTCGKDNDVYFGTANGLTQYNSMSAPAAEDYSNVYAYPNPVRPEYTGWITITGLMDNSLVKIADAAGNVFHQAMSEGGMMVWDGCDRQGRRVKTGVYYVFASQGGDGQETSGAVTKILVVN